MHNHTGKKQYSLKHTARTSKVHDYPLYLLWFDVLRAVGETSYGTRMWFFESHIVFTFCLFIYLHLRLKSTLIQLSKQNHILPKEKKTNVASLHKFKPLFSVTTLHTTSPAPLYYFTVSVSLPVPLSAPNRLSRSTISVSNGSPNGSWQWNLRRILPRRSHLTPAIDIPVVPTMFGYSNKLFGVS
jgi:hypothetical protein